MTPQTLKTLSLIAALGSAPAAFAQTDIPGHVLDANPQLNNWGERVYINNTSPQNTNAQRQGVYHGSNRWSSQYETYPIGSGPHYISGYGPFNNVDQLMPSRFSYELHAPLYEPRPLQRSNDRVSAPVYTNAPQAPVVAAQVSGPDLRINTSLNRGPINGRISNGPIDTRLRSSMNTGASSRTSQIPAIYDLRGAVLNCVSADGASTLEADMNSFSDISNVNARFTIEDAFISLRLDRVTARRGSLREGQNRPDTVFALAADAAGSCTSYDLVMPGAVKVNTATAATLEGKDCSGAAPTSVALTCTAQK